MKTFLGNFYIHLATFTESHCCWPHSSCSKKMVSKSLTFRFDRDRQLFTNLLLSQLFGFFLSFEAQIFLNINKSVYDFINFLLSSAQIWILFTSLLYATKYSHDILFNDLSIATFSHKTLTKSTLPLHHYLPLLLPHNLFLFKDSVVQTTNSFWALDEEQHFTIFHLVLWPSLVYFWCISFSSRWVI